MERPSAKNYSFFLKNLCRGPPTMALGKEMLQKFYFFKKIFAEGNGTALGKGPFFAEGLGHCPRQRGRNLNFFLFFAFHRHKHFIYISHRTHFVTIYHNHNCKPQMTIYYNDKSHVHHHLHVYYDKFMKSKHKSEP